jgi:hypothetical protein
MEILWWQERGGVLVVMVVEAKPTGEEAGQIERERERERERGIPYVVGGRRRGSSSARP